MSDYTKGYWDGFRRARLVLCDRVKKEVEGVMTLVGGFWVLLSLIIIGWFRGTVAWAVAGAGIAVAIGGIVVVATTVTKACAKAEQEEERKARSGPGY